MMAIPVNQSTNVGLVRAAGAMVFLRPALLQRLSPRVRISVFGSVPNASYLPSAESGKEDV